MAKTAKTTDEKITSRGLIIPTPRSFTAVAKLRSVTSYSQSRYHDEPKLSKESPAAYEDRTWREKTTCNAKGEVVIPAVALTQCLQSAAQLLGQRVPGKGQKTYSTFFKTVFCKEDVPIGVHKDKVEFIKLMCSAKGIRGAAGGARVLRTFPIIRSWSGTASFFISDATITEQVFLEHLAEAGLKIGIGRARPQTGFNNGMFEVVDLDWIENG